jgi:hypothetical protein
LFYAFVYEQSEFVKTLSDILCHGGNSPVARMAAGLQLKNTLTSKDAAIKAQYQQRWLGFPEETRAYVKKNVMFICISMIHSIIFMIQHGVVDSFVLGPFNNFISYSDLCCIEFMVVKGCSKAVLWIVMPSVKDSLYTCL